MKLIIFISLIYFPTILIGQKYQFLPQWKEGEQKTVKSERISKFYLNDSLMGERSVNDEFSIKVIKENKKNYEINSYYSVVILLGYREFLA